MTTTFNTLIISPDTHLKRAKAAKNSGDWSDFFAALVVLVTVVPALYALKAWLLMLLLGALSLETGWPTALGFNVCLILVGLLAVVTPTRGSSKAKD